MPTFAADTLHDFARALFETAGVPGAEAEVVAGSLVDANLCGHDSHGVLRVPQYVRSLEAGHLKAGAPFEVIRDAPGLVVGSSRVDLQACKLEYSIVSPK